MLSSFEFIISLNSSNKPTNGFDVWSSFFVLLYKELQISIYELWLTRIFDLLLSSIKRLSRHNWFVSISLMLIIVINFHPPYLQRLKLKKIQHRLFLKYSLFNLGLTYEPTFIYWVILSLLWQNFSIKFKLIPCLKLIICLHCIIWAIAT